MANPSEKKLDPAGYRLPEELTEDQKGPCLSLYQPTLRGYPESQQNPIRFRNLVRELQTSLEGKYPDLPGGDLLKPFLDLAGNAVFWRNSLDGLAVFGAPDLFRVIKLQREVPEFAFAGSSFYLKPLRRIFQTLERYQVLGLNRDRIRLFEGTRDILDEIEPAPGVPRTIEEALGEELTESHLTVASYGGAGSTAMHHGHGGKEDDVQIDTERFFRTVDRSILEKQSKPSGLPLMLAALPEHHSLFHKVSRNPFLLEEGVRINPGDLGAEDLRELAWKAVEPVYSARLDSLVQEFHQALSKGLGGDDPARVAEAAVSGRVEKLLIEAGRQLPGHLDKTTGRIETTAARDPGAEELLDDLGDLVDRMGGRVLVVESDRMPSETGVAAIYRY